MLKTSKVFKDLFYIKIAALAPFALLAHMLTGKQPPELVNLVLGVGLIIWIFVGLMHVVSELHANNDLVGAIYVLVVLFSSLCLYVERTDLICWLIIAELPIAFLVKVLGYEKERN